MREATVTDVVLPLCAMCLDGQGGECHTPGCALWMNRAPDISIRWRARQAADLSAMLTEFHGVLGDRPGRGNAELRITLHDEEHAELVEALHEGDRAHIARELADVVYIAFGTAHAFAIDLDAALAEIHRAAMSKLVGPGLPIVREDGKILKPPGFVPPDMTAAVAPEAQSGRSALDQAEEV